MPNLVGMAESLVRNIGVITKENNPQYMVTPTGFLRMLLENPVTYEISNLKNIQDGHEREVKFRYMQRGNENEVTDRDDCDMPLRPAWKEATIERPYFSKIGIFIPDSDIRKWESEASQKPAVGTPATPMIRALYETMLVKLNGLIQKINSNLLLDMAAKWGVNAVTGTNAPQTITFGNSPTIGDGIVKLLEDYQFNEMNGTPIIVGNGAVVSYNLLQSLKTGTDLNGFGSNLTFRVYNDPNSTSKWGANHFGVFAPGFTGLVDFNQYVGGFQNNTGNSIQFLINIPVLLDSTLSTLTLDAQLKYNDCNIYDDGGTLITPKGWGLILSKPYGLFTAPDDMFSDNDRLKGVNGTFHYIGQNQKGIVVTPETDAVWKTTQS